MSHQLNEQTGLGIIAKKPNVGTVLAFGTTVPSAGNFVPGAIFQDIDAAAGSQLWVNEGTAASPSFVAIITATGGTMTAATITTLTTTAINSAAAAATTTIKANTAAALSITDGTTATAVVDTRNTLKNINTVTITGCPQTIATESAAHVNASLSLAAKTITYTGTTTTTSQLGAMLNVGVLTITDASAATLTTASAIHINAIAAAGGSLTISNSRMISTSVTDCYLTNAGVWTDTSCWASGKRYIGAGVKKTRLAIEDVMSQIVPKTWKYKAGVHGDDQGRQRVGIVYDDLPEALRAPGQDRGVSPGVLASFALAALKQLWDDNKDLKRRLAALEG